MDYNLLYEQSSLLTKIIIWTFIFIVGFQLSRIYRVKNKFLQIIYIFGFLALYYSIIYFFTSISIQIYSLIYVLPAFAMSILFFVISKLIDLKNEKNKGPLEITIPFVNGKEVKIDLVKGLSTQGAAGSGKTLSIGGWILHAMGKANVGGVLYDYKDMELVEMAKYFYRDSSIPVHVFAPYNPQLSVQYNPISIDILKTHEDIKLMSKCILQNVIGDSKGDAKFFNDAAEGAITGVIYTLKEHHRDFCSFTYLAAIFLTKDADDLVKFIKKSKIGSVHARAFLDSQDSERQMSAVKATLSNAFSVFANPNIFHSLKTNSVDFSINEAHNKSLFCVVNKPIYDDIYSPILSIVVQSLIVKMSERSREESFIFLDEAPTLKISRIGRVPATMRSFNVATIYMLQDTIQATIQMGRDKMKEIFANLSTITFGKTNDPDTAKHFESYFEEISKKQKSVSFKSGTFTSGDRRTSVSQREEKKHKSYEMFKRDTGEFFIFDSKGKSYNGRIVKIDYEPIEVKPISKISTMELQYNYERILETAKSL
jgi:hypothetical protein